MVATNGGATMGFSITSRDALGKHVKNSIVEGMIDSLELSISPPRCGT